MRFATTAVMLIGSAFPVLAGTGPMIVIPGRPGVPVLINGIDASYGVIEGDWGLAKSVHVQPTVYYGHAEAPPPPVGHYYPSSGKLPGYGRVEIEPPADRPLPPQAESYFRSWSAQSAPPAQQAQPPQNPPPVIFAPQFDGSEPRRGQGGPNDPGGGPGRRGG